MCAKRWIELQQVAACDHPASSHRYTASDRQTSLLSSRLSVLLRGCERLYTAAGPAAAARAGSPDRAHQQATVGAGCRRGSLDHRRCLVPRCPRLTSAELLFSSALAITVCCALLYAIGACRRKLNTSSRRYVTRSFAVCFASVPLVRS